jgi:hypothetical protein
MYVRSEYRAKKFAAGGAIVFDNGDTLVMKPPPAPIGVPDDIPGVALQSPESPAPADQVAATIERARSFRETPEVRQPVSERSFVSAPVAREAMSWSGRREDRPGRITLTIAQKEAAAIAGVSEVQYAEQLIRLREEKANGNYIGNGQ